MNKNKLKNILRENKGYLKSGAPKLVKLFNCTYADAKSAVKEINNELNPHYKKNINRLFYDIETSPNVMLHWRVGYNMNLNHDQIIKERAIICISYKWENSDKIYSLRWDKNQCDKKLLEDFIPVIESADEVIGHNVDGFDTKWVAGRALYHRLSFPSKIRSFDTLKKCRAQFNLNSNKLDYISKYLGLPGKKPTGFNLWKSIMLNNDKKSMDIMVDYCEFDVELLQKVYDITKSYTKPNTHQGVHQGESRCSCPNCGATKIKFVKDVVTTMGTIKKQCKCNICHSRFEVSNKVYKDF